MTRTSEDRRGALLLGAAAEAYVSEVLQGQGWEVLDRNWRGGGGELDLVVRRGSCLRFVEVKAREPQDPVGLESIDGWKRGRLSRAARAWLAATEETFQEACFLVALVEHADQARSEGGEPPWQVYLVDDAFDVTGDG